MKLGNISQSIIPVPRFFLNKRSLDLFTSYYHSETNSPRSNSKNNNKKKKRRNIIIYNGRNKSYYRTKDILSLNCDININLNPRTVSRESTGENTKKYIPIYHRNNYPNNAEMKETFFPDIIDMNRSSFKTTGEDLGKKSVFQKYKEFKNKTNIEEIVNPDLRKDIMHNTQNLLERINMNYDLKKWNDFDSRTTLNRFHQTAFSPLTDVIQNNISDKDVFNSTLRQKALTLKTISSKAKEEINKVLYQKDFEKKMKEYDEKIKNEKADILLKYNNRKNFLKLSYNNCDAPQYNDKDKKFINENKSITNRINRTKMYKEFPSSIKEEFDEQKYYKKKKQLKLSEFNNEQGFITKEKYGFKNVNCNGDEFTSCQSPMWLRPLHSDAFK